MYNISVYIYIYIAIVITYKKIYNIIIILQYLVPYNSIPKNELFYSVLVQISAE